MDEPDWTHRDSDVLVWQLPGEEVSVPQKKKKPVLHPAAGAGIIIAALMTGTLFGTVMIRAVDVPEEKPVASAVSEAPVVQETKKENVPLFIIQGGLFSTKEAAQTASAAQKIPTAVIPMEKQFILVYGAFLSKTEADEEEKKLEASGLAAYVKQVDAEITEKQEKALAAKNGSETKLKHLISILSP